LRRMRSRRPVRTCVSIPPTAPGLLLSELRWRFAERPPCERRGYRRRRGAGRRRLTRDARRLPLPPPTHTPGKSMPQPASPASASASTLQGRRDRRLRGPSGVFSVAAARPGARRLPVADALRPVQNPGRLHGAAHYAFADRPAMDGFLIRRLRHPPGAAQRAAARVIRAQPVDHAPPASAPAPWIYAEGCWTAIAATNRKERTGWRQPPARCRWIGWPTSRGLPDQPRRGGRPGPVRPPAGSPRGWRWASTAGGPATDEGFIVRGGAGDGVQRRLRLSATTWKLRRGKTLARGDTIRV